MAATEFLNTWPLTEPKGILFTGTVGTGKTHLTVAILLELVRRGATGRFVDFGSLLRDLRATYSDSAAIAESEVLKPVIGCDVLALDEIGAAKQSEWSNDVIEHIISTRYNEDRTTILTTNFEFRPPSAPANSTEVRNQPFIYADTLGDRIGHRMFSRLQEMCQVVEMKGLDYRARVQQAHPPIGGR